VEFQTSVEYPLLPIYVHQALFHAWIKSKRLGNFKLLVSGQHSVQHPRPTAAANNGLLELAAAVRLVSIDFVADE
jgi:hypothetical protein